MTGDLSELIVADAAAWRAWLAVHHRSRSGVWLVLAKKDTTQPTSLSYDQAMFDILTSQNRYAVLYRIASAKRPATRTRRIEQFVAMLARGETVYPQKRTLED